MKPLAQFTTALVLLTLVLLYACQDTEEPTQPSAAVAVSYRLTVSGLGTGNGVVTSNPSGINCRIIGGRAATTGCSRLFTAEITVTLTAKPDAGHAFGGWSLPCTGTSPTCGVRMSANRTVTATFRKGPFTIRIASATSGTGSGTVTTQATLTPRINCNITNGTTAATGCSRSFPANTVLTLTAAPAAGFVFDGWREPGCGTGNCQFSVIDNRTIPVSFSRLATGALATQGSWTPPFRTPVVAVHVHLLVNGKVLLWGDTGNAYVWNPNGGFTSVAKTYRIYCSGHTYLPDGRLLVVGGTSPGTRGLRLATIFDPATNRWTATRSMAQGRYYPTNTTLPNGHVLAISGHDTAKAVVTIPEVWNGSSWRRLTTAPLSIPNPFYPAMFVAPNGKVFLAGFNQPTRYLDVSGTGQWTTVAHRNVEDRVLGTAVMYAPGKVLYAGGGQKQPFSGLPTATAEVIDLNQAAPSWRPVPSMAFARKQLNATILADGRVLVNGGTSGPGFNDQPGAVHTPELWNPETETWTSLAPESRHRTYHAATLLLPDARVLSTGGGEGGGITYTNSEFSAQIFTPPYLYNANGTLAARPSITSAPSRLSYRQAFTVLTPHAATVRRGTLIRLGSVTHAFNMSQHIYHLNFTQAGSGLTAVAPPSGNVAPPGPYMLFLINESGVPSVSKIVIVGI